MNFQPALPHGNQFTNRHLKHLLVLFTRLGIVLLIYFICRLLFFFFNYNTFTPADNRVFIGGIRFDAAILALINLPFAVLSLLPFPFRHKRSYQKMLVVLFYVLNIPFIMLNIIDIEYFKFTFKRSTADLLDFVATGDDTLNLIPVFLFQYWYLVLLFLAQVWLMVFLYRKTRIPRFRPEPFTRYFFIHLFLLPVGLALVVLLGRGGVQLRPISLATAGLYANIKNTPLVLNTPFVFIKTFGKAALEPKHYFEPGEAEELYPVRHEFAADTMRRDNVVIIVLESFSKEYIDAYNDSLPGYTPFLDSLITQSLHFTHSFANGKKSMEAMPSIFAGIPNMSYEPYITSQFAANNIQGLPHLLGEMGYATAFYHGGLNGTMGFDLFSHIAGFDHYYGRNEYTGPDSDYDGIWGIFDEPYLHYVAADLDKTPQPFMAGIFTLSSHHPFTIPPKYKDRFKTEGHKITATIQYADLALRKFFETAKKSTWFENTLFVITADHTSITQIPYFGSSTGMFAVPIIFYAPGDIEPHTSSKTVSHIDIMPGVLDYLHYPKPFFALGSSVFNNKIHGRMVNFLHGTYWYIKDDMLILWQESEPVRLYNYITDPLLKIDRATEMPLTATELQVELKAVIQIFNNRMIENKWYLLPEKS